MTERNKNRCAVLLPPGQHFERLFDEILEFAILDTGLVPFRLQHSSQSPLPINVFVEEIEQAGALFADISEPVPEIWMAVGCAAALGSPLCLISSRLESSLPLGIEHLPLIAYPAHAFPADYIQLQQNITAQLSAIMPQPRRAEPESEDYPGLTPSLPYPGLSADLVSDDLVSDDLVSYEILALTIIDLKASEAGLSPRALGLEMQASECGHLTSHAMNALRRRRFIERKPVQVSEGDEIHISENLFLTRDGEDWLIRHGKRTPTHRSRIQARAHFTGSR